MIVEMSELATIRKADIESLKAMLTTCADDQRLSYERDAKTYPRTCVFIGTTNEVNRAYIADATGARRFWPVRVGVDRPVDTETLAADVEQLWAEAVEAYEDGEDWYSVPKDLVATEQSERQITVTDSDPWYGVVLRTLTDPDYHAEVYKKMGDGIEVPFPHMLLTMALNVDISRQTPMDAFRLENVLRAIGFRMSKKGTAKRKTLVAKREDIPHLWDAIEAARAKILFPKSTDVNGQ